MTENVKIKNLILEKTYRFSLEFKGKMYENLSIEVNNYWKKIKIFWINYDRKIEKIKNFRLLEKKIFQYFTKKYKKFLKETEISIKIPNKESYL